MRFSMWIVTAAFCGLLLTGRANAADGQDNPPPQPQPPNQRGGGPGGQGGGPGGPGGGPGGPGGGAPGFHLIPRFAAAKLNLTDDQKKQVADLEKEVKEKLAKILTPEQMKTLEEARPPRGPGGGGQGGRGGPGGGPNGGPDGQGAPGNGKQDGQRQPPPPPSN